MTDNEQRILQQKVDVCEVAYAEYYRWPVGGSEVYEAGETALIGYVNSLLAERDAQIRRYALMISEIHAALGEITCDADAGDAIEKIQTALRETDNDPS